jgi:acetyl-CoA carboxylase beta subunit
MNPLKLFKRLNTDTQLEDVEKYLDKNFGSIDKDKSENKKFSTGFSSPKCPNCKTRMLEILYSHEVHQEMYWCSNCGTLNVEVNAEDTWMKPTYILKRDTITNENQITEITRKSIEDRKRIEENPNSTEKGKEST